MMELVLFSRPEGWLERGAGPGASDGHHNPGSSLMKGLFLEDRNRCG